MQIYIDIFLMLIYICIKLESESSPALRCSWSPSRGMRRRVYRWIEALCAQSERTARF